MSRITLNYPLFDGRNVIENASVTIADGIVTDIATSVSVNSEYLLMPGLIDAHTHITNKYQLTTMLQSGIIAACDVCAPDLLVKNSEPFTIISSAGMAMGTLNGKGFVRKAIESGAKYIKVLLFEPNLMPRPTLKSICQTAHEYMLKVAVHATSVKSERMALDCGADILIHVPMKEKLPEDLAAEIAERGLAVAPTLVMMKTFACSGKNGYIPEHYGNAENAVRTLHKYGVEILAATDANTGSFAPAVAYGSSLHQEMKLLCHAGLTPVEALESATRKPDEAFDVNGIGTIEKGKKANFILVEGSPDKDITAFKNVRQIWINGAQIR